MLPRPSVSHGVTPSSRLGRLPRTLGALALLLVVLVAVRAITFRRPEHTVVSTRLTGPWLNDARIATQPPPKAEPPSESIGTTTEKASPIDNTTVVDKPVTTEDGVNADSTMAREDTAVGTDSTGASEELGNANEKSANADASLGTQGTTPDDAGELMPSESEVPTPSMDAQAIDTASDTVRSTAAPAPSVVVPEPNTEPYRGVLRTVDTNLNAPHIVADLGAPSL